MQQKGCQAELRKPQKLENQDIIKYLYSKGLRDKEINKDTLAEQSPSLEITRNWIASFIIRKFFRRRMRRTVSLFTPVNIEAVRDVILSDRQIWLKRLSLVLNAFYT